MTELIYHSSPAVTFAANTFINVPVILQFDDVPLVSIVREEKLGYTTEIPIYHSDGTYLAKVRGTRVYQTKEGAAAKVEIRELPNSWVCNVDGQVAFEIHQQPGDAFRVAAELNTPTGYLVKVAPQGPMPQLYNASREALKVGGIYMSGNVFQNVRIGVWMRSNGSLALGAR
jgi:hypothetical protein